MLPAALSTALREVGSPSGRLAAARAVQQHVYGADKLGWAPRPYADNKGRCGGDRRDVWVLG